MGCGWRVWSDCHDRNLFILYRWNIRTCCLDNGFYRGESSRLRLVQLIWVCSLSTSHYENTPIQIYTNFSPLKTENFQIKNSDIFHISAQNIDCGYSLEPPRRGGSNEYPQSMFWAKKKTNNVYPCKPQFYCIKVGFKGSKLYRHVFVMSTSKAVLYISVNHLLHSKTF